MEHHLKSCSRCKNKWLTIKCVSIFFFTLFLVGILFHIQSQRRAFLSQENYSDVIETMNAKLTDSVTFLPLVDPRFRETATTGHTWFMSSLNYALEENEAEHLYFPSKASKGRLLCFKGRDTKDGMKNLYALTRRESIPDSDILLESLTFVSDTYYDHTICGMDYCLKPARWVLFHWGELKLRMGSCVQQLVQANFGKVKVGGFDSGDVPCYFEKTIVMSQMGQENKLKVFDLLRCEAKIYCGINPAGKGIEINRRGVPIMKLTLLMRRGSRSFKNATVVTDTFAKECALVEGCILHVTKPDIVASPVGAKLPNMLFMDRESSVMEFYPKGWLEYAGAGQYAYHWMANQECPSPQDQRQCFSFHKDGMVEHNETYFAEWARRVIDEVRLVNWSKPLQIKQTSDSMIQKQV
ncbi:unnamed protein product [Withania somnifera]